MAKTDNPPRKPLQIRFGPADGGIAAADKANGEFLVRHSIPYSRVRPLNHPSIDEPNENSPAF
jgi:hypothetical protein